MFGTGVGFWQGGIASEIIFILVFVASVRVISSYAIPILSITFLIGGIVAGLIVSEQKKKVFVYLGNGSSSMLLAVFLIAFA